METHTTELVAARARLDRIRAKQASLEAARPALDRRVRELVARVEATRLEALVEGGTAAREAAAAAQAALDATVLERDEAEDALRLLSVEAGRLERQLETGATP